MLPAISEHLKNIITKSFIHKDHLTAIAEASQKGRFTVTFREAGEHTISCVGKGAPMKGHDILEKTIKESSLKKAYPDAVVRESVARKLKDAGLFGCVGHWDKSLGLVGLYIVGVNGGKEIIPLDVDNLAPTLLKIQQYQNAVTYTGDYDTHDMLTHRGAGRPRTVISDSPEERQIIDAINSSISAVQPYRGVSEQYNPIRHGAQVNFVTHMIREEKESVDEHGGVIRAVAEAGEFPLAAVSLGKWSIIKNIYELEAFYTSIGAVLKETWKANGVRKFHGSGDYVSLKQAKIK